MRYIINCSPPYLNDNVYKIEDLEKKLNEMIKGQFNRIILYKNYSI